MGDASHGHVVLLGDSIFDNASYVPGRPPVIDQLRQALPRGWRATLLAVDGHVTDDVVAQLGRVPSDATHLVVSAGGNDALGESHLLAEAACTVGDALGLMAEAHSRFRQAYHAMLRAVVAIGRPVAVCTVYDTVPGLGPAEQVALAGFNEIILREAVAAGVAMIDLRLVCNQSADYSHVSPIEPSAVGGAKIARVIADVVTARDFDRRRTTVFR
jgi:hypothetical protein